MGVVASSTSRAVSPWHDASGDRRGRRALLLIGLSSAPLIAVAGTIFVSPVVAVAVSGVVGVATFHRTLFSWRFLFGALFLLIFFVPVRRYTLGGSLSFQLEPYRLLV